MTFGNQAIIEAGIDQMDGPNRLELAAQLVASVVYNEHAVGNPSASEAEIREHFEDELESLLHQPGLLNTALVHDTAPRWS